MIREDTTKAAASAAEGAIEKTRADSLQAARSLSQAAGEARRQAWRYFGGFWVWLAAMLATGVVLGLLIAYGMETAKSALSVDDLVRYNCGRSWFGDRWSSRRTDRAFAPSGSLGRSSERNQSGHLSDAQSRAVWITRTIATTSSPLSWVIA